MKTETGGGGNDGNGGGIGDGGSGGGGGTGDDGGSRNSGDDGGKSSKLSKNERMASLGTFSNTVLQNFMSAESFEAMYMSPISMMSNL